MCDRMSVSFVCIFPPPSQLRLHPGIILNFTNNTVSESGAGIYVDFPPIRFVIEFFNRLCFIQYSDGGSEDVAPQDWVRV